MTHKFISWSLAILHLLMLFCSVRSLELTMDFYKHSCPLVEAIIRAEMLRKQAESPTTAGAVLRMFFHDCFVDGCDASVLVASSPRSKSERDADINLSLAGDGFDAVKRAKAAVEKACPGVVSCADVLAIATRDLVHMVGGPFWQVRKGRRDGLVSKASHVGSNVPVAAANVTTLTNLFESKGLNQVDLVALSGAHSIGFAHCVEFMDRIRNFNGTGAADPTMDTGLARSLEHSCPVVHLNPNVVATFDSKTPFVFDNAYYSNLQKGLGLLTSDQELFNDRRTRALVDAFASREDLFFQVFANSMQRLGEIGVKNATEGIIRKQCDMLL